MSPHAGGPSWAGLARRHVPGTLLVALVAFGLYANTLPHGFVFDDAKQVLANPWITEVRFLPEILTHGVWGFWPERGASGYYRPLMHILYLGVYLVAGLSPWAYHLLNVILHAITSVLVLLLAAEIRSPSQGTDRRAVPWIAALLFAAHPIHSEAVAWVGGVPDLSFSLLYLLSFWLYVRSTRGPATSGPLFVLSLAAFALAMLAKEPAVTLPLVLLAWDGSFGRARLRRSLPRHGAYLMVAGAYLAVRISVLGGAALGASDASPGPWLPDALALFARYMVKLLLPLNLNAYHPASSVGSFTDARVLAGVGLAVLVVAALALSLRRSRLVLSGLLVLVVPLLPALYIPAIGGTPFAERYLYLPSAGFAMLAALVLVRAAEGLRAGTPGALAAAACVALVYAGGTWTRNGVWSDDLRLWSDTVRKSPESTVPRNNLGRAYFERGELGRAVEQYRVALQLDPRNAEAHNNLGAALATMSRLDEAEAEFRVALELRPDYSDAHNNLGILYGSRGEPEAAIAQFQEALRIRPDYPDAHHNLGVTYLEQGRLDLAIAHLEAALRLEPDAANTHLNLARAYERQGRSREAREHRARARALAAGRGGT